MEAQRLEWVNKIGGSGTDIVNQLATDAAGNVYAIDSYRKKK